MSYAIIYRDPNDTGEFYYCASGSVRHFYTSDIEPTLYSLDGAKKLIRKWKKADLTGQNNFSSIHVFDGTKQIKTFKKVDYRLIEIVKVVLTLDQTDKICGDTL